MPNIAITDRPPQMYSKDQIQQWIDEAVAAYNPQLPAKLVDTEVWAEYVNYHHFVPLTVEGVPQDYFFNYNWAKDEKPHRRLPTAEVIETGDFLFWQDRCNYYEMTPHQCRDFIGMAVHHEGMHYEQWRQLAISAIAFLGYHLDPKKLPSKLADLEAYPGAKDAFMRVWSDGAHYQCREVEVYTSQMTSGDMSLEKLGPDDYKKRLEALRVYAHGDENSPGCANSAWAPTFAASIKKADELIAHAQ